MKQVSVENKAIVFKKDDRGWYAEMEGTRSQNAMVSGADVFCEVLAQGRGSVEIVFSADVAEPGEYLFRMRRIEHDPWGATYRVSNGTSGEAPAFRGILGLPILWLCNQTERFVGGEHPVNIYVKAVTPGA